MSASALAAIWIAALLPGTAVIVLVLAKRAALSHDEETRALALPPRDDGARDGAGNGHSNGHGPEAGRDLLLLRMSHDLRGPLGSLVTLCQLLAEGDAGPLSMKQRQYVEVIRRSGQSVLALVDDILDLAALESGRSPLEVEVVDLAPLARQIADARESLGRENEIPIQVSLPREPLLVSADPRRLGHLIDRMVEHVLAATEHGYVEIAVQETEGDALVRVRNTRDGLSEAARHPLAPEAANGDEEGAAAPLPIAVAARLARQIGLPIEVRTGADEGLSLELGVPLAPAGATATATTHDARRLAGGRILLVDDDSAERLHVTARLEEAGYTVTAAASGSEGLARLRDGRFDAVVLDLVMPGLSGLEVLRAARTDEGLAHLPFVVLSALYITRSERAVLGPAVASVVRKGEGTADELLRALERALAPAAEPHAIGDRHV
ncbi:MAG TPA: histidine kinase dimerization/phospho-acceptor domain-containing protein [Polyangia bacterium]|nr:histidine kinase dimerization/phospho-acceptor domain-containing protein [Polyangia bacterium]